MKILKKHKKSRQTIILFLYKVLILDIGLSLVDVVSDFMQVRLVSLDKPGLELLNLVTGQTRTRTVKLGDWTNQD